MAPRGLTLTSQKSRVKHKLVKIKGGQIMQMIHGSEGLLALVSGIVG